MPFYGTIFSCLLSKMNYSLNRKFRKGRDLPYSLQEQTIILYYNAGSLQLLFGMIHANLEF